MPDSHPPTFGVILAGGLARRLGGADKALLPLGGRTLLARVAERLGPQCDRLIINANGSPEPFEDTGLPVVPDSLPERPGPLAGVLASLEWAASCTPSAEWVVSVPCDTPFLPSDLVWRLHEIRAASQVPLACASSESGIHHAVGLWPVRLRHALHEAIRNGTRSIREWTGPRGVAHAFWTGCNPDPFFNINTLDDLAEANAWADEPRTNV